MCAQVCRWRVDSDAACRGRTVAGVTTIWVESLRRNFEDALDVVEAAIRDCTDELWQMNMWEVPDDDPASEVRGPDGNLITDPAERHPLVQRHGQPWGVAWHALEILHYDLTAGAGFVPWEYWPPFGGRTGSDVTTLPTLWTRADLLGYVAHCRQLVDDTLKELTDEEAATVVPPGRRARGRPYAWLLTSIPGHVMEHASQVRQFITAAGVAPDGETWTVMRRRQRNDGRTNPANGAA